MMMTTKRLIASLLLAVAPSHAAFADASSDAAAQLLAEGTDLYKAQNYPAACDRLARSEALHDDERTLMLLGGCYEKIHKTASAWTAYRNAATDAHAAADAALETYALEHTSALEPQVGRLVIDVPAATAAVDGLVITLDGQPFDITAYGVAEPTDAGTHQLRADAPGGLVFTKDIEVTDGGTARAIVEIPAPVVEKPLAPAIAQSEPPPPHHYRKAGWITLGASGAVLAAGVGFGYDALRSSRDAKADCPTHPLGCGSASLSLDQRAGRSATTSDVLTGVAVAGAAIGAYLVITSPKERAIRASVGLGAAGTVGLAIDGRF
jgi:hypothetical protein